MKFGFTVSHARSAVFFTCSLLFDSQRNEISVGMMSCCLNKAHSCFIDHKMLQIMVLSFCLPSLYFDLYTSTLELLSPKMFLYTNPDYLGNKRRCLIKHEVHITGPNKYFVALNLVPCRGPLAPTVRHSATVRLMERKGTAVSI